MQVEEPQAADLAEAGARRRGPGNSLRGSRGGLGFTSTVQGL